MIKNFFWALLLLSFWGCTKKETRFDLSSIVQTDINGNIIDRGNSTDWLPKSYGSDSNFQLLYANMLDIFATKWVGVNIKNDCPLNDSIISLVYPNPVPVNILPHLKITSSIRILDLIFSYRAADGGIIGYAGGISAPELSADEKEILYPFSSASYFPTNTDVEIYCMIVTADSCAHYTKGKVKFL